MYNIKKMAWIKVLPVLGMLLFVFSGAKGKDTEIRVLTYNIHHATPPSRPDVIDLEAIAQVIKRTKADLVALQEVDVHTERSGKDLNEAKELAKATGMFFFFVKTIDHQGGDYGIAILSKYPFLDSASFMLPNKEGVGGEPRGVASVSVEPKPGKKLRFICTHLDFTKGNAQVQAQEINRIFQDEKLPAVLCGDFNATPESEALQELGRRFTNTCKGACGFTIPQVKPSKTIDFIMIGQAAQFDVCTHEVINEPYASDHLPVFAKLTIK